MSRTLNMLLLSHIIEKMMNESRIFTILLLSHVTFHSISCLSCTLEFMILSFISLQCVSYPRSSNYFAHIYFF